MFGRMAFIHAEYVPAMRNKGKLLKENHSFLYNLSRKREKKTYWIYQKKNQLGCKVTAVVLCKEDDNGASDDEIIKSS